MVVDDKPSEEVSLWHTYKIPIILGLCSLLLIVLSIYLIIKVYQSSEPIQFDTALDRQATSSALIAELLVDISGAVEKPGVYRLPLGSRVDDAIMAAGGMTREADLDRISLSLNRAAKLADGAKVYIPQKNKIGNVQDTLGSQSINAPIGESVSQTVSINTGSSSDLERLNGIGPATSAKIIAGRPYTRLEELVTKKAMSQSVFDKLKSQLAL